MHAKWTLELCNYFFRQNEIILNGFKAGSITEAAESAKTGEDRKPFQQIVNFDKCLGFIYFIKTFTKKKHHFSEQKI